VPAGDARDPEAVRTLTARHTALLEAAVRERPAQWFWLHKRWKTALKEA
jgi:KDO2-lipid IV(A) lauroyltransferase